jgi:hypothetical protein
MSGGEASVRKGMERTRLREPALGQHESARPVDPVFLAPSANGTPPESKHPIAEHSQTREVSRYQLASLHYPGAQTSPFHSMTQISANKQRKLVKSPFVNCREYAIFGFPLLL